MVPLLVLLLISRALLAQADPRSHPDAAFTGLTPQDLWTNGIVPYLLDSDIPNPSRITDAVAYYNANTPIAFQPRVAQSNYVHLVRSTVGNGVCESAVGMVGGEQFIEVEDACTTATLIHEMGHTVGFYHEQSRHDRNRHVTVLYENVNKFGIGNFNQNAPPQEQDIGVYDYASHMHYSAFEFSSDNLPVMQSVPAGIPFNSYSVLSPGDLDTLFRMYGKPPSATTLVTNPPGLRITVDGQTVTSPQVLNWAAGSMHTLAATAQTNGPVRYTFGRWSDGGAVSHTVVADPSVTFYSLDFVEEVPVTVGSATPAGGSTALDVASPDLTLPDGYLAAQTVATMTATPASGYTFLHWGGGSCPRVNGASPTSFVVGTTPINCQATFTQSPVTTIVTAPPNLPVTIDGVSYLQTPVNEVWPAGSTHTIAIAPPASNATSPARYIFQSWSDGGAASHEVTAQAGGSTFTANYKTQYSLVLPAFSPSVATISVTPASPDVFYDAGTRLQITATPAAGWSFVQWTRDTAGQPNPASLIMDSQKLVGALFSQAPAPLATANSASFANTAIAPGELITLFRSPSGINAIGPEQPVSGQLDASGRLGTTAGGASVTIGGLAAPILYASANQTSVVVPYGVAGKTSAVIQTQYGGKTTAVSATVDATAPGVFTAAANGLGQVLAANQDGTLNSESNPAQRGSVVVFYATGAGQLSPNGVDGQVTTLPLPSLSEFVSVRIGGKVAELLYAGPAPGEVSGVLQVNARIPSDAPSGPDSLYLVIGTNSSPAGVSLAVK